MSVIIAADHAGFEVKEHIKKAITGVEFIDLGTDSTDSVHYPNFASNLAKKVVKDNLKGIVICGSGIGVSIVANKYQGARAALCHTVEDAKMSRLHNDSNILCLGARTTDIATILEIINTWLNTEFEGGRHQNRVDLFNELGSPIVK